MKMMQKRKVTLFWASDPNIYDPYSEFSVSSAMLYLSKILQSNGFDVVVIDSNFVITHEDFVMYPEKTLEKIIKAIEKTNPDILGIGSWTCSMPLVAEFVREFKARNPYIQIILGGSNATHVANETLELLPEIDFCVRGEGEYTLLELCQALSSNKKNFGKIKGISYRNKEGKIVHTPDRPQIKNLDELPLVDLECYYEIPKKFSFPIHFERGCIGKCSFCSINSIWKKPSFFSPEHVVEQIKHAKNLYSDIKFIFYNDNLFSNVFWAKKVAENIHRSFPDLEWASAFRMEPISNELMLYMEKMGLRYTYIGIESNIPKSLVFFNKTIDPKMYIKRIPKVLEILGKLNIFNELSFMTGAPDENKRELINLKNFMLGIREKYENIGINWAPYVLLPGPKLWGNYLNGEIKLEKLPNWETWADSFFKEKYQHLIWMVPKAYTIKNNKMTMEDLIRIRLEFERDIGYGIDFQTKFNVKSFKNNL
jgi:radical SAM superfamily enzyme YgiQ (UPF0313 family)